MKSVFLAIAISITLISGHVSAQSSPQALIAGVVLEAGEIDSSKVEIGVYIVVSPSVCYPVPKEDYPLLPRFGFK